MVEGCALVSLWERHQKGKKLVPDRLGNARHEIRYVFMVLHASAK